MGGVHGSKTWRKNIAHRQNKLHRKSQLRFPMRATGSPLQTSRRQVQLRLKPVHGHPLLQIGTVNSYNLGNLPRSPISTYSALPSREAQKFLPYEVDQSAESDGPIHITFYKKDSTLKSSTYQALVLSMVSTRQQKFTAHLMLRLHLL